MKVEIAGFDAAAFVAAHPGEYIVFLTGGWNYKDRTAYYDCLLCFNGHRKQLHEDLQDQNSPNSAMLQGAIHACSLLRKENTVLHLISPTPLGFMKGKKGRGPNVEMVQELLGLCKQKNIKVMDIDISGGGDLIRDVINGKVIV